MSFLVLEVSKDRGDHEEPNVYINLITTHSWVSLSFTKTLKQLAYTCKKTGGHDKFTKSMTPRLVQQTTPQNPQPELSSWHSVSYTDIVMTKREHSPCWPFNSHFAVYYPWLKGVKLDYVGSSFNLSWGKSWKHTCEWRNLYLTKQYNIMN